MQQSNPPVAAAARGKPIAVMPLDNQINSVAGTLYLREEMAALLKSKGYALLMIGPRLGQVLELTRAWRRSGFQVGDIAKPLP